MLDKVHLEHQAGKRCAMKRLWQFRVFALEMVVGLLIGAFGLLQLLFKVRLLPVTADPELMEKIAAALVTIGGTVLLSGIFRFAFSVRLDDTEQRILDSLRLGRNEIVAAITNFHPKGHSPRPDDQWRKYNHFYWRTKDENGATMWLRFQSIEWRTNVLPYLETDGRIEDPRLEGTFNYHLVMVKLQGCLAVSATRAVSDGASDSEMAAVYVFSIPVSKPVRLYGFLRHVNMAGNQSLSSCILSSAPIEEADLDRLWLAGSGKAKVDRNFPVGDEATAQTAAA
jgi:hypothetical protein